MSISHLQPSTNWQLYEISFSDMNKKGMGDAIIETQHKYLLLYFCFVDLKTEAQRN